MGLYDRDYWKERQPKVTPYTKYAPRRYNPNKNQIHPLYWVLLAFVIILFGMSKFSLPKNRPAESLSGKTRAIFPESIPGGLVVYADSQGHFRGNLKINETDAPFMIDTGATTVTVPAMIASQSGLILGQPIMANTAGGTVVDHSSVVDKLTFGNAVLYNVPVVINQHIKEILIGVDLMKRFKITHNRDSMVLAMNNENDPNVIEIFDPNSKVFSPIENMNGIAETPTYSTPSVTLPKKSTAQTTWTKTVNCDNNSHCKTSYH